MLNMTRLGEQQPEEDVIYAVRGLDEYHTSKNMQR